MSVKIIDDKTIAGTKSMGRGSYAEEKKGGVNPMQWWVYGKSPATKNFVFATNYL